MTTGREAIWKIDPSMLERKKMAIQSRQRDHEATSSQEDGMRNELKPRSQSLNVQILSEPGGIVKRKVDK